MKLAVLLLALVLLAGCSINILNWGMRGPSNYPRDYKLTNSVAK